jgi:hypothetical protein
MSTFSNDNHVTRGFTSDAINEFAFRLFLANIFSFVAMSADSVPSSKTNIFQNKLTYCRHIRTYSRCAMFDWSDTVFRWRNVTRRRISNTVLPEVCRLLTVGQPAWQESSKVKSQSHDFRFIFYEKCRSTLRLKYVGLQ